ncbi:MAG TPA: hypothetical protein VHE34_24730 [Puia sp.]|uniref:hypothetical protein n=1 Tax=Puia sp. TaxID=2045100 RepID=UPI002CA12B06|nr:hypothetical protein [Puia sp.]HVU98462.1 hypothetical protein [Puia sp.]
MKKYCLLPFSLLSIAYLHARDKPNLHTPQYLTYFFTLPNDTSRLHLLLTIAGSSNRSRSFRTTGARSPCPSERPSPGQAVRLAIADDGIGLVLVITFVMVPNRNFTAEREDVPAGNIH